MGVEIKHGFQEDLSKYLRHPRTIRNATICCQNRVIAYNTTTAIKVPTSSPWRISIYSDVMTCRVSWGIIPSYHALCWKKSHIILREHFTLVQCILLVLDFPAIDLSKDRILWQFYFGTMNFACTGYSSNWPEQGPHYSNAFILVQLFQQLTWARTASYKHFYFDTVNRASTGYSSNWPEQGLR